MYHFTLEALILFTFFSTTLTATLQHRSSRGGNQLAVYYGQGPNQKLLGEFCQDDAIDIIPIGFVSALPGNTKSVDGYPTLNFGNQCGGGWIDPQGHETGMFRSCGQMIPEIKKCQQAGKKILLSIGGDSSVYFQNSSSGIDFAHFLWGAFGPYQPSWKGPRPFGNDVVLDGFDFDIETMQANSPVPVDTGMAEAANTFRQLMGPGRLITAAPQCVVPDRIFKSILNKASFDAVFVQFYNTPYCSARSSFDSSFGKGITYDAWVEWLQSNSLNKKIKAYIGLPASPENYFYLQPAEVQILVDKYRQEWPTVFGGVMIWEATSSDNNRIQGMSYAAVIKKILQGKWSSNSTTTSATPSATSMTTRRHNSTVLCTGATTLRTNRSSTTITPSVSPSTVYTFLTAPSVTATSSISMNITATAGTAAVAVFASESVSYMN